MAIGNLQREPPRAPHLIRRTLPLPLILPGGSDLELHPILRPGAAPLFMTWDARTPPSSRASSPPLWLSHPATFPALTSMDIRTSDAITDINDRPIVVFPSAESGITVVTVQDVLSAVHRYIVAQNDGASVGSPTRGHPCLWKGLRQSTTERELEKYEFRNAASASPRPPT
ncbi:hypothetical protein FA13DRAFT_1776737 [Coprinellus micaceus]|uniref:DUF6699 domain-containing protein n=1 Tax=Coprinellus micaceus TaxID=71717 RepID=A0A4Y7SYD2_COPMI|nr:hypothetical protein FA13DRAFT_1776737 [Coprinellus micaceus]